MKQYSISASCAPDQLLNTIANALCNLYGILEESIGPDGQPLDLTPINQNLALMGLKLEPLKSNLVDITGETLQ